MSVNLGYCCISMKINENLSKDDQICVNRSMKKNTFQEKGLNYVSEKTILNLKDLQKILRFNLRHNILLYRMSSDMFPWFTEYDIEKMPKFNIIRKLMEDTGKFILDNNMRTGFHPAHHLVLNSENDNVVKNSVIEFDKHSQLLDLMQLPQNTYYYVNVHLNSSKPNLDESSKRFCNNFNLLSDSSKKRITVENDDKQALYTIQDLHRLIHLKTGIPIVADSLHWKCHNNKHSWHDSLHLAASTWNNVKQLCHHSNSKKLYEDGKTTLQSHTDFMYEKFDNCSLDVDVELECKMKDVALFKYKRDFVNL